MVPLSSSPDANWKVLVPLIRSAANSPSDSWKRRRETEARVVAGSSSSSLVAARRRKQLVVASSSSSSLAAARRHRQLVVVGSRSSSQVLMKMLIDIMGKNFVIKYEGSFKSGNSECLVLEHVHHDRPEVLKREIDVFQLQWYAYYMFRALAGLHKQGIVHRDVKPGNFLFSRKVNKGYLIDFNLAMDLHQKYGAIGKLFNHVPPAHTKSLPPTNQKFLVSKSSEAINKQTGKRSKLLLSPKNLKKKAVDQTNAFSELGSRNVMKSQGADGSGVTSAKDATSTRTPSAERSPHQGHKVDIWSAGVTLLYLMIGRTPFTGEPEQNIKEIAKLKGSEDLWEVAKLHNRESSCPVDLFDVKFLTSTRLRDWCKQNTKRPEFLEFIPRSLFDLVEKCLTVNPRSRISAEEALRHEFFTPCHDGLRQERLLRKGLSLDSRTTQLLHRQLGVRIL
ncbi:hypothetical protein TEA_010373 [Camellia sinensis var. sinensis]|uniref:non-specific serine/threonine protein kinase n=1 Tax=Camellia sinensis var. sinensis TaxID=542762 RepID=A0A4V3WN08_CAMSN|nr:hypothetical protein TEA_010373 [Camellia sinensis var. sinensis]